MRQRDLQQALLRGASINDTAFATLVQANFRWGGWEKVQRLLGALFFFVGAFFAGGEVVVPSFLAIFEGKYTTQFYNYGTLR